MRFIGPLFCLIAALLIGSLHSWAGFPAGSSRRIQQPPPAVTGVLPTFGRAVGGDSVAISGNNFSGATTVLFGANQAASFTVNNGGSITATTPAGTADTTVDVVVATPAGTSPTVAADKFSYQTQPTVTAVAPTSGAVAGGYAFTVTGTDFLGASAVKFSATNATSFTVASRTSITGTVPAGSAGTVDVTVTTASGTSLTSSADHFTYNANLDTSTGGTISVIGNLRVHVFRGSGTFTASGPGTVSYWVIGAGGGGGGAALSGGGGAGAIAQGSFTAASGHAYAITVGAGGASNAVNCGSPVNNKGANGGTSTIAGIISSPGGGGGAVDNTADSCAIGNSGGSGGGGGVGSGGFYAGGAASGPNTNPGGSGQATGFGNIGGGGGGGCGGAGGTGGTGGTGTGGPGGAACNVSGAVPINSFFSALAGGGGGGNTGAGGGAGAGAYTQSCTQQNTGSGGGSNGGTGCAGLVILWYVIQ